MVAPWNGDGEATAVFEQESHEAAERVSKHLEDGEKHLAVLLTSANILSRLSPKAFEPCEGVAVTGSLTLEETRFSFGWNWGAHVQSLVEVSEIMRKAGKSVVHLRGPIMGFGSDHQNMFAADYDRFLESDFKIHPNERDVFHRTMVKRMREDSLRLGWAEVFLSGKAEATPPPFTPGSFLDKLNPVELYADSSRISKVPVLLAHQISARNIFLDNACDVVALARSHPAMSYVPVNIARSSEDPTTLIITPLGADDQAVHYIAVASRSLRDTYVSESRPRLELYEEIAGPEEDRVSLVDPPAAKLWLEYMSGVVKLTEHIVSMLSSGPVAGLEETERTSALGEFTRKWDDYLYGPMTQRAKQVLELPAHEPYAASFRKRNPVDPVEAHRTRWESLLS